MSDGAAPERDAAPTGGLNAELNGGRTDRSHEEPDDRPGVEATLESTVSRLDYALDTELEIDTPTQLKALGDPLRSTIVDLVLERAMTVTELADLLDRPRGSVAYHVDVLVDAGLLQVVRTRRVRAIEERFYGRTAFTYVLPHRAGEIPFIRDVIAELDVERMANDGEIGFSTYRHARIPIDRIGEYAERLQALALEFAQEPRAGDTEFGFYVAVFPTNRLPQKPSGREAAADATMANGSGDDT